MTFSDPAVSLAHESALRSIARVVEETTAPTPPVEALRRTVELFQAGPAMILTGAGVSTDSGIPDYRGDKGKLRKGRPMTYQEFLHDVDAAHRYWARSFVGWRLMRDVSPNRTHFAIAELERAGYLSGLVTQNVDGLHADAGSSHVVHLHGDMGTVVCLDCGFAEDRKEFDQRMAAANPGYVERMAVDNSMVNPDGDVELPPEAVRQFVQPGCVWCGSRRIKPDVVYFGESVPSSRREKAGEILEQSSFLLVAGSSLAVMSGYRFAIDAQKAGKPVVIVNGGPSRADPRADVLWRTDVAEAFDAILDGLGL